MSRPPELDVLFEPVRIGPVTTKNRFYQVPHCNGMGRAYPSAMARMREVKAEGGWGVVSTEQCDIHHSGNHLRELRLWDEKDIPYLARAAEGVHRHGALAAVELVHNGAHVPNLESRTIPIAPSARPVKGLHPVTARAMTKADIRALRRWHRHAVLNARRAGFDIVYVYAGHDMTLPVNFLSRRYNQRTDEYGGSLENRVRLMRELLEDAKEAVGDTTAVALRFGVDQVIGPGGAADPQEARAVVEMLADLPDLWDVNLANFEKDGASARFAGEGAQAEYVSYVRGVTSRPVVGVGRFTSPDIMAGMVRSGVLDLIGAARPSIADPFLPRKIENGDLDDLRECVGSNVCLAHDAAGVPIRCTQNPTMGEEWRRNWHPERIPARDTPDSVLIVGAGPAGLEAARALGQRGYPVILTERRRELGGRVTLESSLPGLHTWARVRDWRVQQLRTMPHVRILPQSEMTADLVLEAGCSLVGLATGARWRGDGVGRRHTEPLPGVGLVPVFTPDDMMAGRLPAGHVVLYDDDHDYLGAVITERLVAAGCEVTFVTPQSLVSAYTQATNEQGLVQRRMRTVCRQVRVSTQITGFTAGTVVVDDVYGGGADALTADAVVLVTSSMPDDRLYRELVPSSLKSAGIRKVVQMGDALAPGTIAAAVFSGHLFGRTLDTGPTDEAPYRRENVELAPDQPLPGDMKLELIGEGRTT
ncbi:NAD(P)-binding protein [Kineosporia mesophila]|uniref:NAD(P)-binding protein n=1 Tax=Kineosporia mesophila TaxID=566012 RepID=A0ABP7AAT3_9ACTN|nr:NAD(P)-binding protein [Kineosporia mesophila]MCD5351410.1 NAD(P)-binding protein [Kineosporia mesophila]